MHFVIPRTYRRMIPSYLPAPDFLVYASGVAEIAGGAGLMAARTRRPAGWWLIATLAAIFPANIEMARNPERWSQIPGGATTLKARLPVQALLVAWVLRAMRG
jgi:uncharacterized membrane protein